MKLDSLTMFICQTLRKQHKKAPEPVETVRKLMLNQVQQCMVIVMNLLSGYRNYPSDLGFHCLHQFQTYFVSTHCVSIKPNV